MSRDLFVNALRERIGAPYLWGGVGEGGYDCSGLIITCLNAAGHAIGRTNASGLCEYYYKCEVIKTASLPGALFFYGEVSKISHVMAVLDRWRNGHLVLVGARGGDSTTTTIDKAAAHGAMVDVVESNYWNSKFVIALDPFRT